MRRRVAGQPAVFEAEDPDDCEQDQRREEFQFVALQFQ